MLLLARRAMAQLTRQRRLSAQLEFDLAAMAAAIVDRLEVFVFLVISVRLSELPHVLLRDLLAVRRLYQLVTHSVGSGGDFDGRVNERCYKGPAGRCNGSGCW